MSVQRVAAALACAVVGGTLLGLTLVSASADELPDPVDIPAPAASTLPIPDERPPDENGPDSGPGPAGGSEGGTDDGADDDDQGVGSGGDDSVDGRDDGGGGDD